MKISHESETPWSPVRTVRGGVIRFKCLLEGREGTPSNYSLVLADTDVSFKSPRHRHNFDQIRITLEGSTNFGPRQNIEVGDVAYFPEGTHYGPQDQSLVGASSLAMVIQFGGASGEGYMSQRQLFEGQKELLQSGRFEGGIYRRNDDAQGRRNQDAYEAIWEHQNGRPLHYPKPRLTDPVHFRAGQVPWQALDDSPGVATRFLGVFTERDIAIGGLRLDAGAKLNLPADTRDRLVFFTEGEGTVRGQGSWRARSAMQVDAGETTTLQASTATEALVLALPRF